MLAFRHYFSRFLGYFVVSDVKMTPQTESRYNTFEFLHSHRFSRPKNLIHAVLRPKPSFYQVFFCVFGEFWVILGVCDATKGVRILKSCISDNKISFTTLKNLPMSWVTSYKTGHINKAVFSHFCLSKRYTILETLIGKWILRSKWAVYEVCTINGSGDMKNRLLASFWRFYRKRFLMSNFTRQIRTQHHQIAQKKFIPLITSDVDPSLTLPLV